MSRKAKQTKKKISFDKYDYYRRSVQAPDSDVLFFRDTYKEIRRSTPKVLREDFCGTHALCCEWVKLNKDYSAYGVDLDREPLEYGQTRYVSELTAPQRDRVHVKEGNVLSPGLPRADIICAMNFSYFIFKERSMLRSYFKNCLSSLNKDGILIIDCFGGSRCQEANEEETIHDDFSYFWDQESYDPVTNHALFHIHFKPKGSKKLEKVFTYDWRMWTIPELREMMDEAGFRNSTVYWEGTTKDGEGDGNFQPTEVGEECEAWIAYIIGEK